MSWLDRSLRTRIEDIASYEVKDHDRGYTLDEM